MKNRDSDLAKASRFDLPKSTQYYNMGSILEVESRELSLKSETNFSTCLGITHLQNHTYLYVKDIVAYVEATFGIKYTIPGMTNWLHQHGFSYKKPAIVPGKANPDLQKQWIQEYEVLRNKLSLTETICFIDGVHLTHNTKLTYGWITGAGHEKPILQVVCVYIRRFPEAVIITLAI